MFPWSSSCSVDTYFLLVFCPTTQNAVSLPPRLLCPTRTCLPHVTYGPPAVCLTSALGCVINVSHVVRPDFPLPKPTCSAFAFPAHSVAAHHSGNQPKHLGAIPGTPPLCSPLPPKSVGPVGFSLPSVPGSEPPSSFLGPPRQPPSWYRCPHPYASHQFSACSQTDLQTGQMGSQLRSKPCSGSHLWVTGGLCISELRAPTPSDLSLSAGLHPAGTVLTLQTPPSSGS